MDELRRKIKPFSDKLWRFIVKTADWIAYFTAPIIIIRFIYLGVIGEITFKFNLLTLIFAIFTIILLPIIVWLTIGPNGKQVNKTIARANWRRWITLGKSKFVFFHTFRHFAIVTTYFTFAILILDYKDAISFVNHIYYLFLIINFSTYGLIYGIHAWNYNMNEQNTMRNKIINWFQRRPA